MENLDMKCAQVGRDILSDVGRDKASDFENLITKSLAVLQSQGIYACILFIQTQASKFKLPSERILEAVRKILNDTGLYQMTEADWRNNTKRLQALQSISEDLLKYIMAKELIDQVLVYARYHAKAI